jgi:hypothetical protein
MGRLKAGAAMREILELYPRFLVFCGVMAAFLFALMLVPASIDADATTMPTPVKTTAADTRQIVPSECRMDQFAYAPTCQSQGRMIRAIQY